jgi:gamma-tubulin complex component 2
LHFLSLCGAELVKNVDDVMPSRLESLLELALRTSTANADPFKDDLGLELLSYDLTTQMVRILSIQTHEERGNHSANLISFCSPIKIDAVFFFYLVDGNHSMEHIRLTGLEAFSFMYRVRWPVSLVFTTKVMACYQMIFRHLFLTKYVENLLGR